MTKTESDYDLIYENARRRKRLRERVEELESRVDELEEKLRRIEDDDDSYRLR